MEPFMSPWGMIDCTSQQDVFNRDKAFDGCINMYKSQGYTETVELDDYLLMINPVTNKKVKLYYDGRAREY